MGDFYTKSFADYYDIRAEAMIRNVGQELEFFKFIFDSFANTSVSDILDVGCGTGRHSVPLMQSGYSITGLDLNQTMLDMFREKAESENLNPRIFNKDMREIDFDDEFDAIICMNTAFQYLLTDEDILKTLGAFHSALKPGGVVIMDLMNFMSLLGGYKENMVNHYSRDGVSYMQAISHSVENVPGIWNHREFGVIEDSGRTLTYDELHQLRIVNYNEMRRLFQETSFREVRCFGDFADREEIKNNAKRLLFVATK